MCSILGSHARHTKVLDYWTFTGNYVFFRCCTCQSGIFSTPPVCPAAFFCKNDAADQAIAESRLSETGGRTRVQFAAS